MLLAGVLAASPALAQSSATYTYDAFGRLVRVTYPSGGFVAYTYDAADNRKVLAMSLTANNNPVANNDGPVSLPTPGASTINVLANDTDPDNDTRTVNSVTQGAKGSVAIVAGGGSVTYTPNGTLGADSFTYTILDARGGVSNAATVNVNVVANSPPDAVNDSTSTPYNTALSNYNPRTNDTDANGDPITITGVSSFVNGTASFTASTVSFTPTTNFSGAASFNYSISDGRGGTDVATVAVAVGAAPNSPPVAVNDSASTPYNTTLANFNPRTNDSDPNGDPLTITGVSNFVNGTATFTSTSVSFTPTTNFSGAASFRYTIADGRGGTASATVNVTVGAPPGVPDGTVLFTQSTPGAFTYSVQAGVAFVDIELWGGGGSGFMIPLTPPIYGGGTGGGYVKKHIAVTTGQAISGNVAAGNVGANPTPAPTTVASPALTTGQGAPSGGDVNTAGQAGGSPNAWSGGSSPNGGATQNTGGANGNAPGGGGAGGTGLGAAGRVIIKARTS